MRSQGQERKPSDASRSWSGYSLLSALIVSACCASGVSIAEAADGAALFEAKCAACHSIGGGPKAGPDLKGVVARRGKDGAILAMIDPAKAGLGPSMPKLGLTPPEAEAISAYLDGKATAGGPTADKAPTALAAQEAAAEATPEEVRLGQKLFEGSLRFTNGGPACNACHDVISEAVTGGGNLAADLTASFSRIGNQGLESMLGDAPFPVMQAAYEGKAISPEEIRALAGFLQHADKQHNSSQQLQPVDVSLKLFGAGTAGVIVLAGFFSLVGGRRKKRCVNQDIYDRQVKSE